MVWTLLLAAATWVFSGILDSRNNPNKRVEVVRQDDGSDVLVLQSNPSGHYLASGQINGHDAVLLLDTGATRVSIPGALADKIGLEAGASMLAQTANGTVEVFATRLDHVRLGTIEIRNVPASINPGMEGEQVLLGMSFLRHLEMWQKDRSLYLKVAP